MKGEGLRPIGILEHWNNGMMISQRAKRFSSSSFPPRIKHGVNSSGNPEFKMVPCFRGDRFTPAKAGTGVTGFRTFYESINDGFTNIPSFQHSILTMHLCCLPRASEKSHLGLNRLFDRLPARAQNLSRVELFGFVGQNLPDRADKAKSQVSINVDFGNTQ